MSTKNRNPRMGDIQKEDTIASLTSILTQYTVQMDEFYKLHHVDGMDSSNHLYLIRIPDLDVEKRNLVIEKMAERGVATNVHYKPLPMMTAYGKDCSGFPNSYDYYRYTICHQAMLYATDVLKNKKFDVNSTISACITHYIEAYVKDGINLKHLPIVVCNYEGGGVSDTSEGRATSLKAQYKMLKKCFRKDHRRYMMKMALSGQLMKQKISTTPWLHDIYETLASAAYSRRK